MKYQFIVIVLLLTYSTTVLGQDIFQISDIEGQEIGSNPRTFTPFKDGFLCNVFVRELGGDVVAYYDASNEEISILKNEDTGELLSSMSSTTTELNGHIYFSAFERSVSQLYKFDGKNTKMVVVNTQKVSSSPLNLIAFNDHVLGSFIADTLIGRAIYHIDDSDQVSPINISDASDEIFNFRPLTVFQNELIAIYNSEDYGRELYTISTDFKAELLTDLNPGTDSGVRNSLDRKWGIANDLFFFEATNGNSGRELWVYESGGSPSLININPSGGSDPFNMHTYDDRLFFEAAADGSNDQMYSTDGTDGANLLKNISSGSSGINIDDITTFNGRLYFNDNNDLWSSDGTEAGTTKDTTISGLIAIVPTSDDLVLFGFSHDVFAGSGGSDAYERVPVNGQFSIFNGYVVLGGAIYLAYAESSFAFEIGRYKGGEIKTVADVETQKVGLTSNYVVHKDLMYFIEDTILYHSDGSEAGTDTAFTFDSSLYPDGLMASLGDKLLISLSIVDDVSVDRSALALYDPLQSAMELKDTIVDFNGGSRSNFLFDVDDTIYFQSGSTIYRYRSGASDAEMVTFWDIDRGPYPHYVDGDDVYYSKDGSIYLNDQILVDFPVGEGIPLRIIKAADYVYFTAVKAGAGRELFAYHIPSETLTIREFNAGEVSTGFGGMIYYDNTLYVGLLEDGDEVIYRLNGALVSQAPPMMGFFLRPIIYGDRVYFSGFSSESGFELWRTVEAGDSYEQFYDISLGESSGSPNNFMNHEGLLYFTASDEKGSELWSTDGTKNGTERITDIFPGSLNTSPSNLKSFGETLAFLASSAAYRRQLYIHEPCINGTTLNCATGDCTLASAVYPSTRGVIMNDSYTLPLSGFATIKTGDDLQVNGTLVIEQGARLTVYNEGCSQ